MRWWILAIALIAGWRPNWTVQRATTIPLQGILRREQDPAPKPSPHTDRYGDPLPAEALHRLGTVRFRFDYFRSLRQNLPDGKTALLSTPTRIRWVNMLTGRAVDSWPLPQGCTVAGFSPDGRSALLMDKKSLHLWDLRRRREVRTFRGTGSLGGETADVLFSPDGKLLVTNSGVNLNPGLVRVWDLATGRELWQEGEMGFWNRGLTPLGFLRDGHTLMVLERASMQVSLRDRATGRQMRSFPTMPINDSRQWGLSPDGKTVFIATAGSAVRAWDVASGREFPALSGHTHQAHSFAVSPDSKTVLTGGADPFILVWDWPAGKLRRRIELGPGMGCDQLAVSADGLRAEVSTGGESAVHLFDLKTGRELPTPTEAHRGAVFGLALAADGLLVSGAIDNTIRVWDPRTGRQLHAYSSHHPLGPSSLSVSADGRLVATADSNLGVVRLHDRDTGRLVRTIDTKEAGAVPVAFAPRGRLLAIAAHGAGRFVGLWDADTGRELRRFAGVSGGLAFSPDGRTLATAADASIRLWSVADGRLVRELHGKLGESLTFSPDGRMLAACDFQGVTVWELASARVRWRIETPDRPCADVCFSPKGRWLAVANEDDVRVYDLLAIRLAHTFTGHDSSVLRLAFARDGSTLASASFDSSILIWDMAAVKPPRPSPPPDATAAAAAWKALAGADAPAAYRAIGLLVENPTVAASLLEKQVRPAAPVDSKRLETLLTQLNSNRFRQREAATQELERLGDQAAPALHRLVATGPSLDARRRAEHLLARLDPLSAGERLREVRAVEILERIATDGARRLLRRLARGAPAARLTREARAALARLSRSVKSSP